MSILNRENQYTVRAIQCLYGSKVGSGDTKGTTTTAFKSIKRHKLIVAEIKN